MVRVKSVGEYVQNYVRKSLMAFLEGEQNSNWIKGVIENSGILKMEGEPERIFDRLKDYGDHQRYQSIFQECQQREWI